MSAIDTVNIKKKYSLPEQCNKAQELFVYLRPLRSC